MTDRYRDPDWLRDEAVRVLEFYYPGCVDDDDGGFLAQLDADTGELYDERSKHLVASARFTVNFALGDAMDGPEWCGPMAERGVRFLREAHYDSEYGGYDWLLDGTRPVERTRVCYGHAFVLLAFARASEAGVVGADDYLEETYDILLDRFWEDAHGLCVSEYSPDWSDAADYRGQNANMHTCEAMLAAHEATGDRRYLDRALDVARSLCVDLARETDGLLWEHYTSNWEHDFAYNRDDPRHQFRPWGYQPGHHVEWAKLLAVLDRHADTDWALDRARDLFDAAVSMGWDHERGGLYYTVDRDGDPVVADRYGWPVAEGIGAAAALYERTGEASYLDWYDRFWAYAESELVAPGRNWYEKSPADDSADEERGPEVEPGYHPVGACVEARRSFERV